MIFNRLRSEYYGPMESGYSYNTDGQIREYTLKYGDREIYTKEYEYDNELSGGTRLKEAGGYKLFYDERGNIKRIEKGGERTEYTYDSAGRIKTEKNTGMDKKYEYYYISGTNNIDKVETRKLSDGSELREEKYNYYTDGKLKNITEENPTGTERELMYDEMGMVLTSLDNFAWTRGTLLSRCGNYNYAYDENGKRYHKSSLYQDTVYYYDGDRIIAETRFTLYPTYPLKNNISTNSTRKKPL